MFADQIHFVRDTTQRLKVLRLFFTQYSEYRSVPRKACQIVVDLYLLFESQGQLLLLLLGKPATDKYMSQLGT